MLTLSDHILDITENSIRAGAKLIEISVDEDSENNLLTIEIKDDGHGMDQNTVQKVLDPFYTTKTVRRIGLGLPLLKDAAERSGGTFQINSQENQGTTVKATFGLRHLDRQPLGGLGGEIDGVHGRLDRFLPCDRLVDFEAAVGWRQRAGDALDEAESVGGQLRNGHARLKNPLRSR